MRYSKTDWLEKSRRSDCAEALAEVKRETQRDRRRRRGAAKPPISLTRAQPLRLRRDT